MKAWIVPILGTFALGLAGCHPDTAGVRGVRSSPAAGPASLYRAPPAATASSLLTPVRIRLTGHAEPGERVRLATPSGQTRIAKVGADGMWRFDLPTTLAPQLFGLAMIDGARLIQSEGYIVVTPRGTAAQLRAGAGAVVLADRPASAAIEAVDFDSKGGAVVSGRASSHAAVEVWVDGSRRARSRAAADGRFALPLDEPLTFSRHRLELVEGSHRTLWRLVLTPPDPLAKGPYRSADTGLGWRIDWTTPGGGLQTTLLITRDGAPA